MRITDFTRGMRHMDGLCTFREPISIIQWCRPSSIDGPFHHWNGVLIVLVATAPLAQGRLQYKENIRNEDMIPRNPNDRTQILIAYFRNWRKNCMFYMILWMAIISSINSYFFAERNVFLRVARQQRKC